MSYSHMFRKKYSYLFLCAAFLCASFLPSYRPLASPISTRTKETDVPSFNELELKRVVGIGTVSYGFEAVLRNKTVVAKMTGGDLLRYSDIEIEMFRILNEAPTISNIPQLQMAIPRLANPFHNISYLMSLGVSESNSQWLVDKSHISLQVMTLLKNSLEPASLREVATFLKSLLKTLDFAHSRNIMHCDLHDSNYYFDGEKVSLFDWNAAFRFRPNSVKMHYHSEPSFLMPPEAWNNESAVHATVSGFDIYSVGLLTKKILKKCCRYETELSPMLQDFVNQTMLADPYQRPNASTLLQHQFLSY